MKIKEVTNFLEGLAPLALQESYDNSGLLVGDSLAEITGILVALDCTEAIIEEAKKTGCNLVVAHHPIVFSGMKKLTGKTYVERTIISAIKNDIAIYAIHTNLDNVQAGVNAKFAQQLRLVNTQILQPKSGLLKKIVTFCPAPSAEKIREALWAAGAGYIGNYDRVSFNLSGTGTYRGNENSNPVIGEKGKMMTEPEERVEIIYQSHLEKAVLIALRASHPYEEIAFDLIPLDNEWQQVGSGMIGTLLEPMDRKSFLAHVKLSMQTEMIRFTPNSPQTIKKVAICGGSGSFLLQDAISQGADAFVSADFKYHQFFDGDGKILIADIGHFESEQFTIDLLIDKLKGIITTFAVRKTEINTNPITYYT